MSPEPSHTHADHVSDGDYVQLSRLVVEAAWRVDLGTADTLYELFAEDGTLTIGDAVLRGHDQIREWGRAVVEEGTYDGIRHVCGNMRFLRTGADTAEGVTLLTVYFDGGTTVPWTVGEDHDRFVRVDGAWLLADRRWVSLFERRPE
jgi:SnoaL-like domain